MAEELKPCAFLHVRKSDRELNFHQLTDADKRYGWTETPLFTCTPPPPTEGAEIVEHLESLASDDERAENYDEAAEIRKAISHITTQEAEITRLRQRVAELEGRHGRSQEALGLALGYLIQFEPGDSRAVSNEFVSMAAIHGEIDDRVDEAMAIIRRAASTLLITQEAELTRLRQWVAEAATLMEPLVCYHETGGHEGDGSAVHLDSIRQWLDTHQPNGDGAS